MFHHLSTLNGSIFNVLTTHFGLHELISNCIKWLLSSEGSLARHTFCIYNGHLRGLVTLAPIAESLAVELSLPVFKT